MPVVEKRLVSTAVDVAAQGREELGPLPSKYVVHAPHTAQRRVGMCSLQPVFAPLTHATDRYCPRSTDKG